MAKMTCHGLPYVLGRNCDLTKHLNGKTEIALCLALQFGVAWRLKGIRSESCCNWKGHLQRFPPSTVCYLLTADWLASIWHEARCKIEKQFYQRQNQTYLHNFTDRKQHKSCLTPMQSCLVWFPLENTFSLTLCDILPKKHILKLDCLKKEIFCHFRYQYLCILLCLAFTTQRVFSYGSSH